MQATVRLFPRTTGTVNFATVRVSMTVYNRSDLPVRLLAELSLKMSLKVRRMRMVAAATLDGGLPPSVLQGVIPTFCLINQAGFQITMAQVRARKLGTLAMALKKTNKKSHRNSVGHEFVSTRPSKPYFFVVENR